MKTFSVLFYYRLRGLICRQFVLLFEKFSHSRDKRKPEADDSHVRIMEMANLKRGPEDSSELVSYHLLDFRNSFFF